MTIAIASIGCCSKVALARKLAVILHRMLADGTTFVAGQAAAAS